MQKLVPLVSISPLARERLTQVLKNEKAEDSYLRIEVYESGGCACSGGYRYAMSLEKDPGPSDIVEKVDGLTVMVDGRNADLIRGSKIDYHESIQRRGFKIDNPNYTSETYGIAGPN